ncbi:MAG: DUF2130 domain-containing protein [Bacteroidales bacterium]|nr:DUF2130 domain-containing protein [Bacteroidales bacterium]
MIKETKIICPNCGNEVDVNNVIAHQLEEDYKKKYSHLLAQEKNKFQTEFDKLEKQKQDFETQKTEQEKLIAEKVNAQVKSEKVTIEKELKAKIQSEQSERIELIEKELNEKSEQLKEFNKTKAEVEKIKREKDELKETLEAENAKKLNQQIAEEKEKIRKIEQGKNELHVAELKKQLEDQKRLTEEMKRKQEQGSMQLQGEVQELAIENYLTENFPLDSITEIKKGARGADCVQIVNTYTNQNCGTIYYESKRTKDFQPSWIEKFRNDMREQNANIGVLVTDVLPKGWQRMGLLEGIWVCTYQEFKGLCFVLRENIVQISNAINSQENKGEKMVMLYDFLTGNEFRLQVEAIVEGFTQMQTDLNTERRSIQGHWKKREKQIQKVLLNTNFMYSSIKGIAGSAIQPIKTLELPEILIDAEIDDEN